jgi:hypothetical protein
MILRLASTQFYDRVGVIVTSDIIFAIFFFSVHLAYLFAYQNKKIKHKVTFTKSYQKSLRGVKCFSCEGVPLKLEKIRLSNLSGRNEHTL